MMKNIYTYMEAVKFMEQGIHNDIKNLIKQEFNIDENIIEMSHAVEKGCGIFS